MNNSGYFWLLTAGLEGANWRLITYYQWAFTIQWNPDFSNTQFFEHPDNSNQKSTSFGPCNQFQEFYTRFLQLLDFSKQFSCRWFSDTLGFHGTKQGSLVGSNPTCNSYWTSWLPSTFCWKRKCNLPDWIVTAAVFLLLSILLLWRLQLFWIASTDLVRHLFRICSNISI